MAVNTIPNLEQTTLGPLTFVDSATMEEDRRKGILIQGRQLLKKVIAKTRTTPLCDSGQVFAAKRSEAWKELATLDSNADWSTFDAEFDPGFDDSDCDPRLQEKVLAAFIGDPNDANLMGVFFFYNIKIVSESDTIIEVTSYLAPGIPHDDKLVDNLHSYMKKALNETFLLVDGRGLRLMAWEFPTREGHEWGGDQPTSELIAAMDADGFEKEMTPEGKLRRFSRATERGRGKAGK